MILVALIAINATAFCQSIPSLPPKKLVGFINKTYESVVDVLESQGWSYDGLDTTVFNQSMSKETKVRMNMPEITWWTFFDKTTEVRTGSIRIWRGFRDNKVYKIDAMLKRASDYSAYKNQLPVMGFNKERTESTSRGIETTYKKGKWEIVLSTVMIEGEMPIYSVAIELNGGLYTSSK